MITTRTALSQKEITANGTVQVRLSKQVLNGSDLLSEQFHRVSLTPGCDVDGTLAAVDEHLQKMGFPPADASVWDGVKKIIAIEWTDEVVRAYADATASADQAP